MATAYTSLLGLALPVTGELAGTWGDTVNNSITSLLDSAVSGTTTLSTDADVTLTTTTGASNQARQAILLCSGSRAAIRNITAPAQSKLYVVINSTTGGFGVVIRGVGPTTGVTVANGKTAVVVWNGTDFVEVAPATATTATNLAGGVAGSLPYQTAASTTTFLGIGTSNYVLTSTGTAPTWTLNTGTGSVVRATSPTLDTPTFTTSATFPLHIGGTGTTSTLTLRSTSGVGTTGADIIFQVGNNGATEAMRVLNSGNVGIKTTTPYAALDVSGGAMRISNIGTTSTNTVLTIGAYQTSSSTVYGTNIRAYHNFGAGGASDMAFETGGTTERMRITNAGDVGIGTTTPTSTLSVTGSANVTGNVILGDATTDTVTVNGYMGIGQAGSSDRGLLVRPTALTGAIQYGITASLTATSAATSLIAGLIADGRTAAAAFTASNVVAVYAGNTLKGAGSTITSQSGLYVENQTNATNNYGLTSLVSSGTNKWNIYASGTAANYFAGQVLVGTTASRTSYVVAPPLQTEAFTAGTSGASFTLNAANTEGVNVLLTKTRGATIGSNTTVVTGDTIGNLYWAAADGTNTVPVAARISAHVEGTVGTNIMPGNLRFATTGAGAAFPSERMRIDSAGNVGIGVTPSVAKLDLSFSDASAYSSSNMASGLAGYIVNSSATDSTSSTLLFACNGTSTDAQAAVSLVHTGTGLGALAFGTRAAGNVIERMRIDSAGLVGIGTATPTQKLDVYAGNGVIRSSIGGTTLGVQAIETPTAADQRLGLLGFGSDTDTFKARVSGFSSAAWTAGTSTPAYLAFHTTPTASVTATERMRIDSAGNVGIGTTTPVNKLQVNGSFGRNAPVTKTGNFTLGDAENWLICNGTATITVTLPAASSWTGREVMLKTIAAFTVVSASSNVVPLAGGAAGTAILAATAGKFATLVSDGTNWITMAGA